MKNSILLILTFFVLLTCCDFSSDTKQENEEITSIDIAEIELMFEKEKIYLLSVSCSMPYDTVYQILRDYYAGNRAILESGDLGLTDQSIEAYNKNITNIASKYKMSKSKVASLIFSFKYEMRTIDEIIAAEQTQEEDYN